MVRNYREGYGLFASNGILFNHESPRRGEAFVTRKITLGIKGILAGKKKKIYLGNLDAKRDWGYAPEFVEAMWSILQQDVPDDYVIGTGESRSVKEFLETAFGYLDLDWKKYVEIDPKYYRPTEVEVLKADSSKARKIMNWTPKITFEDLIKIMVDADLEAVGLQSPGEGKKIINTKGINWHKHY